MKPKFTNDFTILKDIVKCEYEFVLSLLFNNFSEIIHLLKGKQPFHGEVLEYVYLSVPSYYSNKHDAICSKYNYIDSVIRVIFKNRRNNNCVKFHQIVHEICKDFHIEPNEFDYYYFIALVIVYLESSINIEAYNLYTQFDEEIVLDIIGFLNDLMGILDVDEFQGLFYNHLEDVYNSNVSIDGKVSFIHKDNYSFFLDSINKSLFFDWYLPLDPNVRYPIIITDEFLYNVVDGGVNMLQSNTINAPIFSEDIRYIASYYPISKTIAHFIPFFNALHRWDKLPDLSLLKDLYNNYKIQYTIEDTDTLDSSQNFCIYGTDPSRPRFYIDAFSLYDPSVISNGRESNGDDY